MGILFSHLPHKGIQMDKKYTYGCLNTGQGTAHYPKLFLVWLSAWLIGL